MIEECMILFLYFSILFRFLIVNFRWLRFDDIWAWLDLLLLYGNLYNLLGFYSFINTPDMLESINYYYNDCCVKLIYFLLDSLDYLFISDNDIFLWSYIFNLEFINDIELTSSIWLIVSLDFY